MTGSTVYTDGRGTELRRCTMRQLHWTNRECTWCGQPAKYTYNLLRNGREPLLGRPQGDGKPFCSISCYRLFSSL